MSRRGAWIALVLVVGAMLAGFAALYRLRLARGDIFPAYSTLRADPLGVRALHDSLDDIPSLRVERSLAPLEKLAHRPPRTLLLAGMRRERWEHMPADEFKALDQAVRAGSRVVVAFRADIQLEEPKAEEAPAAKDVKKTLKDAVRADKPGKVSDEHEPADATPLWGVEVKRRWLVLREETGAMRAPNAPADFPESVTWRSDLHFGLTAGEPWQVLYSRAGEPVLVERRIGRGSIVMAADSYFLSNEALQRERAAPLLAWLIGPHARVVFIETHLGIREDTGVAALARRYGLEGAFFTALLLVVLVVWRRMALFVPPAPEADELAPGHEATAGLEALLRRAVPVSRLAQTCLGEWRRTARPGDVARVEADWPAKAPAADAYNAAVKALKRR